MKQSIISILFFIFCLNLSAEIKDITPLNFDLNSIYSDSSLIAAYGSRSSALISRDDCKTWEQIRIFQKGSVVKIFDYKKDSLIAFNDLGDIAFSDKKAKTWSQISCFSDSVRTVCMYPKGAFVRTKHELIIINHNFQIVKRDSLYSRCLSKVYIQDYRYSINCFKKFLIAETEPCNHLIYDYDLNIIDTLKMSDYYSKCGSSSFESFSDSNYYYLQMQDTIYRTFDLKNIEKYNNNLSFCTRVKIINNKVYKLRSITTEAYFAYNLSNIVNKDSTVLLNSSEGEFIHGNIEMRDFIIKDDKVVMVGRNKRIFIHDNHDSDYRIISHAANIASNTYFDLLHSSKQYFFNHIAFKNQWQSCMSNDSCITFIPVINRNYDNRFCNYPYVVLKYYNDIENRLYYYLNYFILDKKKKIYIDLENEGSVSEETADQISFDSYYKPLCIYSKTSYGLIYGSSYIAYTTKNMFSNIFMFDKQLNILKMIKDSSYTIHYIGSKDTNHMLVQGFNVVDKTLFIKESYDQAKTWNIIKSYPTGSELQYNETFFYNNNEYLAQFLFRREDSVCSCEIFNLSTHDNFELYRKKAYNSYSLPTGVRIQSSICSDEDKIYFVAWDTLFAMTDMTDRNTWTAYTMPANGRINKGMQKFGDRFFVQYKDDNNPKSIYWMRLGEPVPKPVSNILVEDHNFGDLSITNCDSSNVSLKISNISDFGDLIIHGRTEPKSSCFTIQMPELSAETPLVIPANGSSTFNVCFRPDEVRQYRDTITFFSNAGRSDSVCIFIGSGIDTTTGIDDTEAKAYLYVYPPYPLPATVHVSSLIYFDNEIDRNMLKVFDRFGTEVSNGGDIYIDKRNHYSGVLRWDCTAYPSGVYFIRVKNGETIRLLKVIVKR